ncbi:DNA-(apurinic or apyrimidinic site) lyase /formamidopyrimidine-DNA glycosylase [Kribbella pratensis]|uniref:DNA-(Apurinic or apyrimidinic site) lyase /formamidopyrimidine-DNA glycosylase n=1 Tax=Kribbella pratensis TaxID=2512112 RepID=A0ABY2FF59_9ACTN|nr:DNA-(apurinic or apyrimidinic site) lyase /formamidopyrimidine-DNA glycosylase [Kribbella pratensis]TDX08894.1 DNA-(apurinic or apyrimidinic site) lyase /formamidopyrimidine-DNA glycosylase [Kribbella sp. VKM Ac-2566]
MPEVESLAVFLRERAVGHAFVRADITAISALKTYDPPISAMVGLLIDDVQRHGKFLDISAQGVHLVIHLARAGWLRWKDEQSTGLVRPGKGPIALRTVLDDGSGFDLTEAGTQKKLAVYVVRDVSEVPGIARLGPDPFTLSLEDFGEILKGQGRVQLKGVLRNQSVIAGIGNAYSDEILHVAKMSPFKPASNLSDDELETLYDAMRETLKDAVDRSAGLAVQDLKSEKKSGLRVHGRKGQKCPVCGDIVREVSFADSSLQYCATCQTGGKPLADRRLSKLLK